MKKLKKDINIINLNNSNKIKNEINLLISYQPISLSEVKYLKTILNSIKETPENKDMLFIFFNLLSKFQILTFPKKNIGKDFPYTHSATINSSNYIFDKFLFPVVIENERLLNLLDIFLEKHHNYCTIIENLNSAPLKILFHYLYSNCHNFASYINSGETSQKIFFTYSSAPNLYFLLKNKIYTKYDNNFERYLKTCLTKIEKVLRESNLYNNDFKLIFKKENNIDNNLYKKFKEHSYRFKIQLLEKEKKEE